MKKLYIIFSCLCLWSSPSIAQTGTTSLVSVGSDGKLIYTPDAHGNTIPDFSAVGYKNGEEAIPSVPVVKTISAVAGDNTSNIQNAINQVASMPLNNGIRGAILLKAGTYNIGNTITIKSSGITLRGEGNTTVFMATKTSQYNLITISGSGSATPVTSTTQKIQGSYIPVGAKTFTLPSNHGFKVGDDVMLQRKPNQAWIHMLGMDVLSKIPCDNGGCNIDWTPSAYTINYIRKVVAVNGNAVTLDAPNMDVIDSKYAEGFIMKYTWSGKLEHAGIENLYFDSKYTNANDEQHGWNAVSFSNAKNGWVNNIEVHHFGYSAVTVNESAAFISILNSKNIDPISQTIGGRKYSFNINGQRNLVKNCTTRGGRHDYVTGAQVAGPNVFTRSTASNQQADIGPHHRWATGILFDVLTSNSLMDAQNRLGYGTGHGWSGAQIMFWNCQTAKFIVQSPPNHMNWAIGCKGNVTDVGDQYTGSPCIHQSTGNFIGAIPSLYEKQLADRMNSNPLNQLPSVSITTPTANTSFNAPASIVINVNATDADGGISNVEFYNGTTLLGSDATPPYSYTWSGVTAGSYTLTTKATDNLGAQSTSAPIAITVINSVPVCLPVSASGDDGNVPSNVLDNNLATRWSANGDGQYIQFCLDAVKNVKGLQIAFYNGNVRKSKFDVQLSQDGISWTNVLTNVSSSGISLDPETFTFTPQDSKYVRIVGHGNTVNTWNSYTEVKILTELTTTNQAPTVSITSPSANAQYNAPATITITANATDSDGTISKVEFYNGATLVGSATTAPFTYTWSAVTAGVYTLTAKATDNLGAQSTCAPISITVTNPVPVCLPVSASGDDGNLPANVLDNNLSTRWSANGDGQWIQFCLDAVKNVKAIQIAFYNGNVRKSKFDVQISQDGNAWTNVLTNASSSGTSLNLETFTFQAQDAKYVRILGHGNTVNAWNSFTEVKILTEFTSPNQAPTVSVTSPSTNIQFNAPATITIAADAMDSDGTVSNVDFYNGSSFIGSDATAPYSFTWTNVPEGTYTITAKATDNSGAVTTSASVTVKVIPAVTNTCSGIPTYVENGNYVAGSKVQLGGKQYQCKPYPYSGWCNGAGWAYAPGTGAYWTDAWTLIGSCSSTARSSNDYVSNSSALSGYPNPFVNSTTIQVILEDAGDISLTIYDKTGHEISEIAKGYKQAGTYYFEVDGSLLKNDLYMIKLNTNEKVTILKLIKTE